MAIFTPHLYLTFGGFLGTSASNPGEIWQCGLRIAANGTDVWAWDPMTPSRENQDSLGAAAVSPLQQWISVGGGVSDMAKMTWVKSAAITATGAYAYDSPYLAEFSPVAGGLTPGSYVPYQVTRVMSLGTDVQRGRATRGRIYTPAPGSGVDINNVAPYGTALTAFKDLINDLNDLDISGGGGSGRYARVGIFSGVDGTSRMVTRVGSDNRYDTQRRRANNTGGVINWESVAE